MLISNPTSSLEIPCGLVPVGDNALPLYDVVSEIPPNSTIHGINVYLRYEHTSFRIAQNVALSVSSFARESAWKPYDKTLHGHGSCVGLLNMEHPLIQLARARDLSVNAIKDFLTIPTGVLDQNITRLENLFHERFPIVCLERECRLFRSTMEKNIDILEGHFLIHDPRTEHCHVVVTSQFCSFIPDTYSTHLSYWVVTMISDWHPNPDLGSFSCQSARGLERIASSPYIELPQPKYRHPHQPFQVTPDEVNACLQNRSIRDYQYATVCQMIEMERTGSPIVAPIVFVNERMFIESRNLHILTDLMLAEIEQDPRKLVHFVYKIIFDYEQNPYKQPCMSFAGVLGFPPGMGKTMTIGTLMLIKRMRNIHGSCHITPPHPVQSWMESSPPIGLADSRFREECPFQAPNTTLYICPPHLCKQTALEFQSMMALTLRPLKIAMVLTKRDLNAKLFQDIRTGEFDIVFTSYNMLTENKAYVADYRPWLERKEAFRNPENHDILTLENILFGRMVFDEFGEMARYTGKECAAYGRRVLANLHAEFTWFLSGTDSIRVTGTGRNAIKPELGYVWEAFLNRSASFYNRNLQYLRQQIILYEALQKLERSLPAHASMFSFLSHVGEGDTTAMDESFVDGNAGAIHVHARCIRVAPNAWESIMYQILVSEIMAQREEEVRESGKSFAGANDRIVQETLLRACSTPNAYDLTTEAALRRTKSRKRSRPDDDTQSESQSTSATSLENDPDAAIDALIARTVSESSNLQNVEIGLISITESVRYASHLAPTSLNNVTQSNMGITWTNAIAGASDHILDSHPSDATTSSSTDPTDEIFRVYKQSRLRFVRATQAKLDLIVRRRHVMEEQIAKQKQKIQEHIEQAERRTLAKMRKVRGNALDRYRKSLQNPVRARLAVHILTSVTSATAPNLIASLIRTHKVTKKQPANQTPSSAHEHQPTEEDRDARGDMGDLDNMDDIGDVGDVGDAGDVGGVGDIHDSGGVEYGTSSERTTMVDRMGNKLAGLEAKLAEIRQAQTILEGRINAILSRLRFVHGVFSRLRTEQVISCPICAEDIGQGGWISIMDCGHMLCKDCLTSHTSLGRNDCPYCRQPTAKRFASFQWYSNHGTGSLGSSHNQEESWAFSGTNIPTPSLVNPSAVLEDNAPPSETTSKFEAVVQWVRSKPPNEKCIIFVAWTDAMTQLLNVLNIRGIPSMAVRGNFYVRQKNLAIANDPTNTNIKCIILSVKENASGTNLQYGANNIAFLHVLDEWVREKETKAFNIERQAIGRVYRIGQSRNVDIVHFVMNDSIESEHISKIEQAYKTKFLI